MKRAAGIRIQIIVLAVVPLAFLVLMFALLLMLARATERSAALSLKGTAVLQRSAAITEDLGRLGRNACKTYVKDAQDKVNLDDFSMQLARIDVGEQSRDARGTSARGDRTTRNGPVAALRDRTNAEVIVLVRESRHARDPKRKKIEAGLGKTPAPPPPPRSSAKRSRRRATS